MHQVTRWLLVAAGVLLLEARQNASGAMLVRFENPVYPPALFTRHLAQLRQRTIRMGDLYAVEQSADATVTHGDPLRAA